MAAKGPTRSFTNLGTGETSRLPVKKGDRPGAAGAKERVELFDFPGGLLDCVLHVLAGRADASALTDRELAATAAQQSPGTPGGAGGATPPKGPADAAASPLLTGGPDKDPVYVRQRAELQAEVERGGANEVAKMSQGDIDAAIRLLRNAHEERRREQRQRALDGLFCKAYAFLNKPKEAWGNLECSFLDVGKETCTLLESAQKALNLGGGAKGWVLLAMLCSLVQRAEDAAQAVSNAAAADLEIAAVSVQHNIAGASAVDKQPHDREEELRSTNVPEMEEDM